MVKTIAQTLFHAIIIIFIVFLVAGCQSSKGNTGSLQSYQFLDVETAWIRNGEPIEFEGDFWYPSDGIEGLLDSEVYIVGNYRGVQIFVDKIDVRPYERLYTKFGKNKFRYFKKETTDD